MRVVAEKLTEAQRRQLQDAMHVFPSVFQATPGRTTVTERDVYIGNAAPIRQRPYRIPYSRRELEKDELEKMMAAQVIRPLPAQGPPPLS